MTGSELPPDVRRALATLPVVLATSVARHLVMVDSELAEDPQLALRHAKAARRRAARVGVVREAVGIAAYHAGDYAEAARELRTARRLTGSDEYLPMIADAERGMGRPQRALEIHAEADTAQMSDAARLELLIVAAGARQDLGDAAAAVLMLEVKELDGRSPELRQPRARLMSAYADALHQVGRDEESLAWLARAAAIDEDGSTGAAERLGHGDDAIIDLGDDDEPDADRPDGIRETDR